MAGERLEILEAALDCFPEGLMVTSGTEVIVWNRAAEQTTGDLKADVIGREPSSRLAEINAVAPGECCVQRAGSFLEMTHKLGHRFPAMVRGYTLRDSLGRPAGQMRIFHPVAEIDALPHGDANGDHEVAESQAEMEERLTAFFVEHRAGGPAFSLLWLAVDQAGDLRRTHGVAACIEMQERVRHALSAGLRSGEVMGRWGSDEFLIVAHERTDGLFEQHARQLVAMARSADLRWWGDRIALTVSAGYARIMDHEQLEHLLERAKTAMKQSQQAGGDQMTSAAER